MARGSSTPVASTFSVTTLRSCKRYTHLLEVGAGSVDLVHEVLHGEDVVLAQGGLDDGVVGEGNALLVDLAVSALVDQLTDRLQVRLAAIQCQPNQVRKEESMCLPVGDVGLNKTEHLLGRLRDLHKHTVVDLQETEELENFAWLGRNLVDTGGSYISNKNER